MGTTISGATGIDKVQDGTIVNADINSSAAIAGTKLVMPTGSLLQVVQSVKTGYEAFSLSGAWSDVSNMSVAITPSSTSSKVLISFSIMAGGSNTNPYPKIKLLKNGSDLIVGDAVGSRIRMTSAWGQGVSTPSDVGVVSFEYLDSPSTISEITYKLQVSGYSTRTFYINITGGSDANNGMSCVSTITAKEIAG